jgi:hypothetical protein
VAADIIFLLVEGLLALLDYRNFKSMTGPSRPRRRLRLGKPTPPETPQA